MPCAREGRRALVTHLRKNRDPWPAWAGTKTPAERLEPGRGKLGSTQTVYFAQCIV